MKRLEIPADRLLVRAHQLWVNQWLLLTAGDFASGKFNTMTVGWGSIGTMWNRPFAHVVVRPGRYTHEFMEKYNTFTLCAFPEEHRPALKKLGSSSGRISNKIADSGLTPAASAKVAAPSFAEASLILECVKLYKSRIDPAGFFDPAIDNNYPGKDYHTIYYGEIVAASGTAEYLAEE